jgi:hypothetical protein
MRPREPQPLSLGAGFLAAQRHALSVEALPERLSSPGASAALTAASPRSAGPLHLFHGRLTRRPHVPCGRAVVIICKPEVICSNQIAGIIPSTGHWVIGFPKTPKPTENKAFRQPHLLRQSLGGENVP